MAFFFGGCKNIFPEMLIVLPESCIPLKAIQYYINVEHVADIIVMFTIIHDSFVRVHETILTRTSIHPIISVSGLSPMLKVLRGNVYKVGSVSV